MRLRSFLRAAHEAPPEASVNKVAVSIIKALESLNFHDATLMSVHLQLGQASDRSAEIEMDYYDWEGNGARRAIARHAPWQTKRFHLKFGFLAHIEFSAPDLVNRAQDIDSAEVGYRLERFKSRHAEFKRQFPMGRYPLFDDTSEVVSLRMNTQNYDDDEGCTGYLWVVCNDVSLEWMSPNFLPGQTHIPLRDA